MADSQRTDGETLFEQYLAAMGQLFKFEMDYPGKTKHPDYTIAWNGKRVVFDVKDFEPPTGTQGFRAFDPYSRLREKIEQGRDKFQQFKEYSCGLVLYNRGNPFVRLQEMDIMLGAMYGDSGFTFPVNVQTGVGDAAKMKSAFLGNGKMIRPNWSRAQNTTISALITLTTIQMPSLEAPIPRVIVWQNAVARMPFPSDLFCGPYDTHFGVVRAKETLFQQVTFRGELLPASVTA